MVVPLSCPYCKSSVCNPEMKLKSHSSSAVRRTVHRTDQSPHMVQTSKENRSCRSSEVAAAPCTVIITTSLLAPTSFNRADEPL